MLSEEKVVALKEKVAEWATLKKVPANIQGMVIEMGMENPRTYEEKQDVCSGHLWSEAIIKWYDDFVEFLKSKTPRQETQAPVDLLLSLKTLRQLLDQIIEKVKNEG